MPRRLVTVRKISSLERIPGHSRKCLAHVDGWRVVVDANTFQKDQMIVFFEIDSFLPSADPRYSAYRSRFTTFDSAEGFRVQTETPLPNTVSQGLILPLALFPEIRSLLVQATDLYGHARAQRWLSADASFERTLGVAKYDPPPPLGPGSGSSSSSSSSSTSQLPLGRFPAVVKPTDLPRWQNLSFAALLRRWGARAFQETIKLDGQSMTAYFVLRSHPAFAHLPPAAAVNYFPAGRFGVCSRAVELRESRSSPLWRAAKRRALASKMARLGRSLAIQGELVGPRINGNREAFPSGAVGEGEEGGRRRRGGEEEEEEEGEEGEEEQEQEFFYVFGAWDILLQRRLPPLEVEKLAAQLELRHVPVVARHQHLRNVAPSAEALEARAKGRGINGQPREGVVFKEANGEYCFKVIDQEYLLQHGE